MATATNSITYNLELPYVQFLEKSNLGGKPAILSRRATVCGSDIRLSSSCRKQFCSVSIPTTAKGFGVPCDSVTAWRSPNLPSLSAGGCSPAMAHVGVEYDPVARLRCGLLFGRNDKRQLRSQAASCAVDSEVRHNECVCCQRQAMVSCLGTNGESTRKVDSASPSARHQGIICSALPSPPSPLNPTLTCSLPNSECPNDCGKSERHNNTVILSATSRLVNTQHFHAPASSPHPDIGKVLQFSYIALPSFVSAEDCFFPTLDIWTMRYGPTVHITVPATFFLVSFRTQLWLGVVSNATTPDDRRHAVFNWVHSRRMIRHCGDQPGTTSSVTEQDYLASATTPCEDVQGKRRPAEPSRHSGSTTPLNSAPDATDGRSGSASPKSVSLRILSSCTRECSACLALSSNEVFGIALCRGPNDEMNALRERCRHVFPSSKSNGKAGPFADCAPAGIYPDQSRRVLEPSDTPSSLLSQEAVTLRDRVPCLQQAIDAWLCVIHVSSSPSSE